MQKYFIIIFAVILNLKQEINAKLECYNIFRM